MIAGFETPSSGTVTIDNVDVTRRPRNHRNVGIVFQAYALFPNMTVAGNIGFRLKIAKKPAMEIAKRAAEMLELINMQKLDDRYP